MVTKPVKKCAAFHVIGVPACYSRSLHPVLKM